MKLSARFQNYKFKNFLKISNYEKQIVLKWRNHPKIRKWMDNKKKISLKEHYEFFKKLKNNKKKLYYLVFKKKERVAVFTLNNIINQKAKIGFYISPLLKKREIVFEIIYYSLMFTFRKLKLNKIYGYSFKKNKAVNILNRLFKIQLKNAKEDKTKFLGSLSKNNWVKNVEKNIKILNYLRYVR